MQSIKMCLRWILATFFIIAFCIGVSFVTVPFTVSQAGFWPSVVAILFSWCYLLLTGFYYLEATLASPAGANVFSISKRYTGTGMAWFSSLIFAFVNYAYFIFFFYLTIPIFSEILYSIGLSIPNELILLSLAIILGAALFFGVSFSILLNFPLTLLMGVPIYFSVIQGFEVQPKPYHQPHNWGFLFIVIPTLVNSIYYNTVIPSLAPFLKRSRKLLQSAIIVALTIVALIFIAWLWPAIASFDSSHTEGITKLNPSAMTYSSLAKIPLIGKWLPTLLSLSILTTGLGVGVVLVDFFSDVLNIPLEKRFGWKRLGICALVIVPPLLLNIIPSSTLYKTALYINDIGALYLAGILPILWIWALRYFYHETISPVVGGGKKMLIFFTLLSLFVFYLVGLEVFYQITF